MNFREGFFVRRNRAIQRRATSLVLILLLAALWSVTHHYKGLDGDARLYAVQALARIHPNLFHDLYLRDTSQDSYTIFPDFYGKCLGLLGLQKAALTLTVVFKILFFSAAWLLARRLTSTYIAYFAVALLIITTGEYGAFGVFHYAEDWVTARSLAEALVVTSLAVYYGGWRILSSLIACVALLVHPLMAFPGLLLLVCLWLPTHLSIFGAAAGILLALGISLGATFQPSIAHIFVVMDASWLEVVRERSQFLFPQLWRAADWNLNARPFLSLSVSVLAIGNARIRRLCVASMLVGATGLAIASIAGLIGPVSLLLQGQAWRWVWLAGFTSVLLLAPTVIAMSRHNKMGVICALLMMIAWTLPAAVSTACLLCVIALWFMRDWFDTLPRLSGSSGRPLPSITSLFGSEFPSVPPIERLSRRIPSSRPAIWLAIPAGFLAAVLIYRLPRVLEDPSKDWDTTGKDDFSTWRTAIPPNANVLVVPQRNSAAFSWFTLERPSYLTVDQSSGVIFSRATALEVRRRSRILLPLMEPDWEILTSMARHHGAAGSSIPVLTKERLISLCRDPELNFVVATESVGFEPIPHLQPDRWKNWNLYDCSRVQSAIP